MKKKEILELIKLNLERIEQENIASVGIEDYTIRGLPYIFPDIKELEKQFDILKKEIESSNKTIEKNKTLIRKYNCDHTVRLDYPNAFGSHSKCVFCNKTINGDNLINGNTIYNSINRNRYCVKFLGGYYDEEEMVTEYAKEDIYQIILSILENKEDEDEIDLVQEIKKINLNHCKIDEREKLDEYYILIIAGINKEKVGDQAYLSSDLQKDGIDLTYKLSGIPRVKVELFDSKRNLDILKLINSSISNDSNVRVEGYSSIDELETLIAEERNVPFDIVINLSNLQTYDINDTQINCQEYHLDLKKYFPNSYLINFSLFTNIIKQQQQISLKHERVEVDKIYGIELSPQLEKYYSLENGVFQKSSIENIENEIKKVLLKKQSN